MKTQNGSRKADEMNTSSDSRPTAADNAFPAVGAGVGDSTALLIEVILMVVFVVLAATLSICLLRYLFRKLRWRLCSRSRQCPQTAQQNRTAAGIAENEGDESPNFMIRTLQIPLNATDNFLEYAMTMPFLFGRPDHPFIEGHFLEQNVGFPPKYDDAIKLPAPIPPAQQRQQTRIISANMRGPRRSLPPGMPPPLYDERILAMLQSTSGSREAPQDSNAERPPAYSIAGLSPPNVLRTPVSRNNSAAIQAAAPPIQGLPNQVDDDKDISEEFPRRIGRSRISSADAAFVNFPVPSTPNLDPKLGQSNLTQSTSSLATVATNVDIESGRRDHKRRENRNATGEREKEDSDSTNKNNTDPRMTLTQALSDGDVNAVSNDNRKPHSRIATPPLSIAMFVPKLQRRLSFSIEATESPAAEARGFGRVKSANVRPRANRPAQICQLNALDLAKLV